MDTQRRAGEPAQAKNSYDPETPQALVDFMATGWAERPLAAAKHAEAARFKQRRSELSRAYPGAFVVVPA
ncbi:MAG TPA: hypothetical protein VKB39_05105, partial [Candidatus Baltobacteraceae bacterium]|nr:hypothetical protein [Candidatus Baltobacteraceae bacterium]